MAVTVLGLTAGDGFASQRRLADHPNPRVVGALSLEKLPATPQRNPLVGGAGIQAIPPHSLPAGLFDQYPLDRAVRLLDARGHRNPLPDARQRILQRADQPLDPQVQAFTHLDQTASPRGQIVARNRPFGLAQTPRRNDPVEAQLARCRELFPEFSTRCRSVSAAWARKVPDQPLRFFVSESLRVVMSWVALRIGKEITERNGASHRFRSGRKTGG
jgi:hypothetical protein